MLSQFLDPYDLRARLFPATLAIVPIPVSVICLSNDSAKIASSVASVLFASGVAFVLSRLVREAGKKLEAPLFESWGGAPTTQLLRHRDSRIDPVSKERFHTILSKSIGKPFPSPGRENEDPIAADAIYDAATVWLRGQTRDTKRFPLVFKENISYGFHRNALGIRYLGALVALVCILVTVSASSVVDTKPPYLLISKLQHLKPEIWISFLVAATMLVIWVFMLGKTAVRNAAFSYSARLLESCDLLGKAPKRPKNT